MKKVSRLIPIGPGRQLHCVEYAQGPSVVYFPGNSCDAADIELIAPAIARRHRFIAIDPPGRATTIWPDEPFDFLADLPPLIDRLLAALRVGDHVIIGHSMGGMLALQHAHRRSGAAPGSRVRGLVLIEGFVSLPVHYRVVAPNSTRPCSMSPEVEAGFHIRRQANIKWEQNHPAFHASFWASQQGHDARPWLNELQTPILFMLGDLGQPMPRADDATAWRTHLEMEGAADLRVAAIPGAGHWLMLDRPRETEAEILRFLAQIDFT